MKNIVLLLVIFHGSFSQGNLGKNIILFPRQTDTDYLILKPTLSKPLKQLTVCLRSYTELSRHHALFSIATPKSDNTFLIYIMPPNICSVSVNQEGNNFKVDPEVLDWKHTCVTWDSVTGLLQLWINGKTYPKRVTKTRSPIGPQMSIILGQDQDSYGGKFEAVQSFVGEICEVNMWDYVLSPANITQYFYFYGDINGNIITSKNYPYESRGNANVLKNEFCFSYPT
ncbi:jeltraxin-like [Phyllobates terribilis]|uniref:jeltraxin-like n=1 Tax=Phyllobates terribilis TaxID=111132 RepID=UPI003CCB7386